MKCTVIHRITVFILLCYFPRYPAGNARRSNVHGYGLPHCASGVYCRIISDRNARKYRRAGAYPNIVFYCERIGKLCSRLSLLGIDSRLGGCKATVRRHKHIVSENNSGTVGYDQIVILYSAAATPQLHKQYFRYLSVLLCYSRFFCLSLSLFLYVRCIRFSAEPPCKKNRSSAFR